MASSMETGAALILDYGDRASVLHSERNPRGTARAFYQHTVAEPRLDRAGLEDITASVNFSALADAGLEGGFEEVHFTTQAWFLIHLGILEDFPEPEGRENVDAIYRLKELILPGGMGEVFKVLLLARGLAPNFFARAGFERNLMKG
jgi:SAM-dependent MidA family methyltransferase